MSTRETQPIILMATYILFVCNWNYFMWLIVIICGHRENFLFYTSSSVAETGFRLIIRRQFRINAVLIQKLFCWHRTIDVRMAVVLFPSCLGNYTSVSSSIRPPKIIWTCLASMRQIRSDSMRYLVHSVTIFFQHFFYT